MNPLPIILYIVELITGILSLVGICKQAYKDLKLYRVINNLKKRRKCKQPQRTMILKRGRS